MRTVSSSPSVYKFRSFVLIIFQSQTRHSFYCGYFFFQGFDFSYHSSFKWAVEAYVSMEASVASSTNQSMDAVREVKLGVEPETDKQYYFDDNHTMFSLPFTFHFLPQVEEEVSEHFLSMFFKYTVALN